VDGWTDAEESWFHPGKRLGGRLAPLAGARDEEVVAADWTTTNVYLNHRAMPPPRRVPQSGNRRGTP